MARLKDYLVSFKLPTDDELFIRHVTNTSARSAAEAISNVRPFIPGAYAFSAELGVVMLYGSSWATYDSTLVAECSLAK